MSNPFIISTYIVLHRILSINIQFFSRRRTIFLFRTTSIQLNFQHSNQEGNECALHHFLTYQPILTTNISSKREELTRMTLNNQKLRKQVRRRSRTSCSMITAQNTVSTPSTSPLTAQTIACLPPVPDLIPLEDDWNSNNQTNTDNAVPPAVYLATGMYTQRPRTSFDKNRRRIQSSNSPDINVMIVPPMDGIGEDAREKKIISYFAGACFGDIVSHTKRTEISLVHQLNFFCG